MANVVEEFENDKAKFQKLDTGDLRLLIKKPEDMSIARFMTLSARLEKILDNFEANIRLDS